MKLAYSGSTFPMLASSNRKIASPTFAGNAIDDLWLHDGQPRREGRDVRAEALAVAQVDAGCIRLPAVRLGTAVIVVEKGLIAVAKPLQARRAE